jgi:hypothetical protein
MGRLALVVLGIVLVCSGVFLATSSVVYTQYTYAAERLDEVPPEFSIRPVASVPTGCEHANVG